MHCFGIIPFHKIWNPAAAPDEMIQFFVLYTGENGWIADLKSVEMQDGQHGAVRNRIEELVGLPGSRQRAGLCFAIADDAGDDEIGVIESGSKGMAEGVTQFPAFMDRPRSGGGDVAGNAAGKGELRK